MPNYRQDRAEAYNQPKKEKGLRRVGKIERSEIDKVERVVEEN